MGRGIEESLADFLRYESEHGRHVILIGPADVDLEGLAQQALAHTPTKLVVRPTDPRWFVHSAPTDAWVRIQECGELRSLARLRSEGVQVKGVGFAALGEPDDYAEYVMFGIAGGMPPEFVVASYNAGAIVTEPDTPYQPGGAALLRWTSDDP